MLRLARAPDLALAAIWLDVLREAGIQAWLQREFLAGGAGELPPDQCLPEIWLADQRQERAAREILEALQRVPQRRWLCACGETVEGGFESCWQCGRPMPL
ncbi:putative signal transducing protein [Ramlibacter algicola]|uniref:DUF2007 domain-containing protein n=1 Tax=Ramlibacter algicola TaxID=2795217 RepID=A0A934PVK5_9BURK|nr:DUF2007 domain-containing protein [Ramlibacter algicola]MBK0391265.1 DUF2007 domain-containing protein [Ramlibacter algicola]